MEVWVSEGCPFSLGHRSLCAALNGCDVIVYSYILMSMHGLSMPGFGKGFNPLNSNEVGLECLLPHKFG